MRWSRHGDPMGGRTFEGRRTPEGEPLRFIYEVALAYEGDDCLTWPFARNGGGYGQVRVDGKTRLAHRIVCKHLHGAPPTPKHEAAHSCGKGHEGCVNPHHLSWKTPAKNAADKIIHGTHSRGEGNGSAKLSAANVERVRSLKGKLSQGEIGRLFGVSQSAVSHIQSGRRWSTPHNG